MAFLQTTATDLDDLLNKLHTFLAPGGGDGTWTSTFNEDLGRRYIGLSKGNCFVAIGSRAADLNISRSPGTDTICSLALSNSLNNNPGSQTYANHPGSLVTTEADGDRIRWNDLAETYNNVWFFSGTTPVSYCHVVVQVGGDRYTHLSFGTVNPLGQTHPAVAYACATYHEWWNADVDCNNPAASDHQIGHYGEGTLTISNIHVRIPNSSVLPAGYPAIGGSGTIFNGQQTTPNMTRVINPADHYAAAAGRVNDNFLALDNISVTGGTPLWALPILFREDSAGTSHVWLGNLPGIRMVNIISHTPGETLKFGSQEFLVFPLKRKGGLAEVQGGAQQIQVANTTKYGFAVEKVV